MKSFIITLFAGLIEKRFFCRVSPVGIPSLIASEIVQMHDPVQELRKLGLYTAFMFTTRDLLTFRYFVTVLAGLFVHGVITIPVIFLIFARRNPLKYSFGMLQAYLTAFGTSSRWE